MRKPSIRPRKRLSAAIKACRDAGLLIREARIGADGEVQVIIGSRSDPDPGDDPSLKHAPGSASCRS